MKTTQPEELKNAQLAGTIYGGLTATTKDGKPARLAIIDEDGNVIDAGIAVAREAWRIALTVHINFLRGHGHLTVHSTPPGLPAPHKAAA